MFMNKAKTRRGKKFLESRAPKVTENDKRALLIKGGKTTSQLQELLNDLHSIKKPLVEKLKYKNPVHLFEDDSFMFKMSHKFDASLFFLVSNSKKHPNTCCLGRMFDHQVLDMCDLQLLNYKPASEFKEPGVTIGTKPVILLNGSLFEVDDTFKKVGNMFVDFFRGPVVDTVRLQGLELVVSFTATADEKILLRVYKTVLKKTASTEPRVELVEVGPSADFKISRTKFATDNLLKKALKKPKVHTAKMRKNTSMDPFETKLARIHVGRQELDTIQTRKVKALKKTKEPSA